MKVLVLWRGPSPYRVDFFNELGKLCDLTVLFERSPTQIKDKNKSWFHENYQNFKAIYLKNISIGKDVVSFEQFRVFWKERKSSIIVLGMYSTYIQMLSILFLKLFRIPYILNSDGGFVKRDSFLSKRIKHFFISGASAYLSSSKGTSDYLRHYGADNNILIYPFTSSFRNEVYKVVADSDKIRLKKKLKIDEEIVILFSGQFIYRKGIDILLSASAKVSKRVGIYIVGGKPTDEYLKIQREFNLWNVHFVDFMSPVGLSEYYKAADIYVLPTREDIWGLVINEAMSYGLPVITTDKCLAGLELIENGRNGYIVHSESVDELSNRLNELIENSELRVFIAKNNKEKIRQYTLEEMAKRHYDFFKKIKP